MPKTLFTKENRYIALSFDEERLRIACMKRTGSERELTAVLKRDIRGISDDELPQTLQSALQDLGVKKNRTVLVVPSQMATTKNIEVPSLDPQEIRSIISLQAGRHTPYSREEIIVGYANIGVYQRNYSKILLVIVNRDMLKKKITLMDAAGLSLDFMTFAPENIVLFYSRALGLRENPEPFGIIDIGCHYTDFIIGLGEKLVACRNIPVGLESMEQSPAEAQKNLVAELKKSVETYQSEDIEKEPGHYILTGDTPRLKDVRPLLQDALNKTVKIVPFLDYCRVKQPVRQAVMEIENESALDVVSSSVTFETVQVDLIPEEVKMQKNIAQQAREMGKAGILVAVLLLMISGNFISKVHFKSSQLDGLRQRYYPRHQEVAVLEKIAAQTRLVKDYLNSRMVGLEMVSELYNLIPEEIYLNSINMDEQGRITIQGVSESMSRVFSFVTSLEESDMFKSVKTISTTAKKERGKDVAAFEIGFLLESARDTTEPFDAEDIEAAEGG